MIKAAKMISRIFSPLTEVPLIIFLASILNITYLSIYWVLAISLILGYLIPLTFVIINLKKGKIKNMDMSKREERYGFNIFALGSVVLTLTIFYVLGEKSLVYFYLKLLIPFVLYLLITFFYKISGHVLVNTIFVLLLFFYYRTPVILCSGILLVFLVGWSRVVLKQHTWPQVISAGLMPFIIYFSF